MFGGLELRSSSSKALRLCHSIRAANVSTSGSHCELPLVWRVELGALVLASIILRRKAGGSGAWHPLSSRGMSCQLGALVLASIILQRKVLPAGGCGAGIHYPPEEGPASWELGCWHPLSSGGRSCQLGAVVLASILLRRKALPAGICCFHYKTGTDFFCKAEGAND